MSPRRCRLPRYSAIRSGFRQPATSGIIDTPAATVSAPTPNGRVVPEELEATRLNPKYTFDTFVIGASNRFAHAATVAVAEAPARAYNPLFVYGGSGLGKTHLLHAIGHYARNLYPNVRVRYVNSEEFTNDFINAIQDNRAQQFQRRYRDVDILLIDDIQFLAGKEFTQEEFFHTFNSLHSSGKQVVITFKEPAHVPTGLHDTPQKDRLILEIKPGAVTLDLSMNAEGNPFDLEQKELHAELGAGALGRRRLRRQQRQRLQA